jgi:hypothetical protein
MYLCTFGLWEQRTWQMIGFHENYCQGPTAVVLSDMSSIKNVRINQGPHLRRLKTNSCETIILVPLSLHTTVPCPSECDCYYVLLLLLCDCYYVGCFSERWAFNRKSTTRSQSYDFWIYSYNASVVVGWSVFQGRVKYLCFQNGLGYPWRCT